MTEEKKKFHHRHLPTFMKVGRPLWWKFSHLFFPMWIHYMTDKYEDRHHHLIVDTIYSVIVFILLAMNIALGAWYYLYFIPAEVDVQILSAQEITSGESFSLGLIYSSPNRDVDNVDIDLYLPDGYVPGGSSESQVEHVEVGDLPVGGSGTIDIAGIVFGNIGDVYTVRAITSYDSGGRRHYETDLFTLTVKDSSFTVSFELPKAVVYGEPVEGDVVIKNDSSVNRKNVLLSFESPGGFVLSNIDTTGVDATLDIFQQKITLSEVAAQSEIRLPVFGIFPVPADENVIGDFQTVVSVESESGIESDIVANDLIFRDGGESGSLQLILPRVDAVLSVNPVVNFGDSITATVTLQNTGNRDVKNVSMQANITGRSVYSSISQARIIIDGVSTYSGAVSSSGGVIQLPIIEELKQGSSAIIQFRVPTFSSSDNNVSGTIRIFGSVYSPEVDEVIAIPAAVAVTKFNSTVLLDGEVLYTGPDGEQLGYGPNPPVAWETTAYRVILSVRNKNNSISGTRIQAQLPSQVEWTDVYSVSAGTNLTYDPVRHMVTWTVPTLPPQSQAYGAQFEVWFTPNHLQIGQRPHIIHNATLTAVDAFTGSVITRDIGALLVPAPIIE